MQALPGRPEFRQIALKWHGLAQRRLDYYTELYRSGRWRHYYTQEKFAIRMLDVIVAAKKWRDLAGLPRPSRPISQTGPDSEVPRNDKMRSAA